MFVLVNTWRVRGVLVSRLTSRTTRVNYYMSYSLNSLKGVCIGDYIGNYYRAY